MSDSSRGILGRAGLFILCALLCLPLLVTLLSLLWPDVSAWKHLFDTVLTEYVTNSLILTLGVGVGSLLLGGATAWCMTQYQFTFRSILRWCLLLPLAMPAYIIAYTYTGMLDVAGPMQSALRDTFGWQYGEYWFPEVRSLGGAVILMSLVLYPYVYMLGRTAFSEQSSRFNEVSGLHGLSRWQHFQRVSFPLARPALFTGSALAMMEALADYGTVHYFGINTFTTGIFRSWYAMGNQLLATQLAGVLCVFVLLVLIFEQHSRKHVRYFQQSGNSAEENRKQLKGWRNILVFLICIIPILLGFLIPLLQLLFWILNNVNSLFSPDFMTLAFTTFMLGLMAAAVVVLLAVVFSYQQRWGGGKVSAWQIKLLSLGYAIPGMVIAVGVLTVFGFADRQINVMSYVLTGSYVGLILSGTLIAMIFAYCVRFLSVAIQNTEAGMSRISPSIDEAAQSLGASRLRTLMTIHSPLLRASIISAVLLVFVDVLKELPATLVLRPFNFNTLAVRTYELASDERLADAALPAITIVLVGLIPILLLTKALDRPVRSHSVTTQ